MLKKILKSLLVIGLLGVTVAGATKAWFTSSVTAADNQITTGTLLLAIDSSRTHSYVGTWGYPNAYVVVEDVDGVSTPYYTFEPWANAEPGVPVSYSSWPAAAGNFSVWLAVRNKGTLPLNYRYKIKNTGDWIAGSRFETGTCPVLASANDALVAVVNVHRYPSDNCEGSLECANLYYGLKTGPWVNTAGVSSQDFTPGTAYFDDGLSLAAQEFVVYRVDLNLNSGTSNCYQGATYQYSSLGQAKQLGASW